MNDDSKTCAGCLHSTGTDPLHCDSDRRNETAESPEVARDYYCEHYVPSIQYRNTRAAEKTANALERLADRFAPLISAPITVIAVRAVEAWLDYSAGNASSEVFQQEISKYTLARDKANE